MYSSIKRRTPFGYKHDKAGAILDVSFFRYVRYICYIICTNAKMPLRPDLRTRRGEKYEYEYAKYNSKTALWGLTRL